ncbi:Regulator of g-protein signaling 5, partial [Globisporangium splendens]
MGHCLSKFHAGGGSVQTITAHATNEIPPYMGHQQLPPEKGSKAKNLVAPQPTAPARHSDDGVASPIAKEEENATAKTGNADFHSGRMKRSHSMAVRGTPKNQSAGCLLICSKFHADMMNALQKLPNFGLSGTASDNKAGSFHRHGGASSSHGDWVDVTKITLREFLDLEFLRRHFRMFLEKERCVNELYFYFEILNFQQFPTSDYLSRQAKKLFNRFCDPTSREFVSSKVAVRTEIENNLNHPSPAMFNKVQEEILSFFATTLFPKFQQSEIYQTIRITNSELRAAKLMTSGNGSSADVQLRGQHGSTMVDSVNYGRPTTAPSRVRNSVAAGSSTGVDLQEDQVTVALILESQETRALFLFFSEGIFCTESIYFWLDCNEFKDIPHKSYLMLRAQKIYRKYVSGHAKLQVNLESSIVKDIVRQLDDPTRNLFVPAQKSITKMLERDTLPKFRRSKHLPFRWTSAKATVDPSKKA